MRSRFLFVLLLVGCEGPPASTTPDSTDAALPADHADAAVVSPPDAGPKHGVGSVVFTVTDDETGLTLPARVIVTSVAPTPPLRFDPDRAQHTPCTSTSDCPANPFNGRPMDACIGGACFVNGEYAVGLAPGVLGAPEGVLLIAGAGSLRVPAGTYDLFITHGPEWEADTRRITIGASDTITVAAALRHSVDTRGWIAADLHVHTARSFDSTVQLDARVVTEVAVGVELIVTTDHNVLSDLQPDLEQLGYEELARAIVGDEFNFYEGHGGAYPMPYDPKDPWNGGAMPWKLDWDSVRLVHSAQIFEFLHGFPTSPVVTVNHPRLLPDLGYFTNMKWSPPAPMPDAGRFDAIEILNGYMNAPEDAAALLRDWFFLLSGGTRVAALGSSDTHRLRDVKAGFPRSWLRLPSDDPTRVEGADLADAIRRQRAIASNGPFALLTVDDAQIGDLVTNQTGQAIVDATVDAPGWMQIDKVRVFMNGKVVEERDVAPGLRPVLHDRFPVKLPAGDAWVALQANGSAKKPLPVALIGEHQDGAVVPFVITNPVFVDGDGDKQWKPALADPRDADPGPLGPFFAPGSAGSITSPEIEEYARDPSAPSHPAPLDCEPPLWADPSTWGNP